MNNDLECQMRHISLVVKSLRNTCDQIVVVYKYIYVAGWGEHYQMSYSQEKDVKRACMYVETKELQYRSKENLKLNKDTFFKVTSEVDLG